MYIRPTTKQRLGVSPQGVQAGGTGVRGKVLPRWASVSLPARWHESNLALRDGEVPGRPGPSQVHSRWSQRQLLRGGTRDPPNPQSHGRGNETNPQSHGRGNETQPLISRTRERDQPPISWTREQDQPLISWTRERDPTPNLTDEGTRPNPQSHGLGNETNP